MKLKLRSLSLNLPFGLGGAELEVSEVDARAAWELYVEFATRVTAHPLEPGAGSVREALDSLHYLFGATREVLRGSGPDVGRGEKSLGPLAIEILNSGLRPFLVRWHTVLRSQDDSLTPEQRAEFDRELGQLRDGLGQYVEALAKIARIEERP